jgi:hypothetical protein
VVCRPCRVPPGARAAESDPARGVEPAYVCLERERVLAFLYLKVEDQREPYHDIAPAFAPKKRLKIGTLKVELNGFKLGERLLKVVFDDALVQRVDEIYVTIFPRSILKTPEIEEGRFFQYFLGKPVGYAIQIGKVRKYRVPFCPVEQLGVRPPQSFVYLPAAVTS